MCIVHALTFWGYSSAGRALEWHSRGQRFDPAYLHQKQRPSGRFFRLVGIVGVKRVKAVRQASDRQTRVCRCDFSRRSETERDPFEKWELPTRLPPPKTTAFGSLFLYSVHINIRSNITIDEKMIRVYSLEKGKSYDGFYSG